jgi:hypothetical protein
VPVLYLVNAQLAEQCVETVHLLAFLKQKKCKNSSVPDPVDPAITRPGSESVILNYGSADPDMQEYPDPYYFIKLKITSKISHKKSPTS